MQVWNWVNVVYIRIFTVDFVKKNNNTSMKKERSNCKIKQRYQWPVRKTKLKINWHRSEIFKRNICIISLFSIENIIIGYSTSNLDWGLNDQETMNHWLKPCVKSNWLLNSCDLRSKARIQSYVFQISAPLM